MNRPLPIPGTGCSLTEVSMTESALFTHVSGIEAELKGIISEQRAIELMITLQVVLGKFLLSEAKQIVKVNKTRDAYIGSPMYNKACQMIQRLKDMSENRKKVASYVHREREERN